MNKRMATTLLISVGALILVSILLVGNNKKVPVTITENSLIEFMTIDDKIEKSDLIVIGEVNNTLPSRWKAPDGNDTQNASPEQVFQAGGLFTDSLISIDQTLMGDAGGPILRVRTFTGEIEQVRWVNNIEPSYTKGHTFLLFLIEDFGPTQTVDPGDYISVNSIRGVYEIIDGKAISGDEEWILEDLIAYIQKSLP